MKSSNTNKRSRTQSNTKTSNHSNGTGVTTDTLHLRPPRKTINLIRKQAKKMDRTMHAHACMLLRQAAEVYESAPRKLDIR